MLANLCRILTKAPAAPAPDPALPLPPPASDNFPVPAEA
jgi:hypothetical protein